MTFSFIKPTLAELQSANLYRTRHAFSKSAGRNLVFAGQEYLNFSSNDYLGLNNHPLINAAFKQGVDDHGSGSSSSNLVTGYSAAHQYLEQQLSEWLNAPRCLLFSTGFAANSGLLSALGQNRTTDYFLDKLSHASLIDGAFNANARSKRFRHNDSEHLQQLLVKSTATDKLIIAEGVYSMDGDVAPLAQLNEQAIAQQSNLYIDDAHGIGVLGENGSGTLTAQNIDKNVHIIQMVTFGKAIATQGAAIAGSEELIEYLINKCRDYIYSTAMPTANALATSASIKLCQCEHWRREKILTLTDLFKCKLDKAVTITRSESSIIGILVGSEANALYCQQELQKLGIWLTAIRPPTVEMGKSRLRVTITSSHNSNDINLLAYNINKVLTQCFSQEK
ncbi:aminotransferase class I/II-fold pyridoxal phosphate-dependent enzyme [Colwelliaceae bacterium BS250]